ncbi:MAG: DUF1015 domain-containing protein, partial [Acidobacteriota bacterium]
MASIYAFKGFRYNKQKVGDVSSVVTQPYDKIPEALRLDYLDRSPHNIVRVIKNSDYKEAADYLNSWISQEVMVQDSQPAIYVYEQVFEFEEKTLTRLGFIALVSLDDDDLAVKGHENILNKPLEDRLNLIRSTQANEGLVFTLFSDPDLSVDRVLEQCSKAQSPVLEVRDDFNVTNRLWEINDPDLIVGIQTLMKGKALYIADGHHRYQTSVSYHQELLDQGFKPSGVESFDKRMIALFNMDSEGMRILATHRAVRNVSNLDVNKLLNDLRASFEVTPCEDADMVFTQVDEKEHTIGLVTESPRGYYALTLKPGQTEDSDFMPAVSGPSRELDVCLLHDGILAPHLGLGPAEVAS